MEGLHDDLLDINLSPPEVKLVLATKSQRLTNYLIDIIFIMIALLIPLLILIFSSDDFAFWILELEEPNFLIEQFWSAAVMIIMYTLMEFSLGGKSIGKCITKTRCVNLDGSKPSFQTIVLRSMARVVPFESFSFLGPRDTGWHDRWTGTVVIDEKQSTL